MKLQVRIDDETFEVEVGDLHARPIVARIGAEEFAVWPETGQVTPGNGHAPHANGAMPPPAAGQSAGPGPVEPGATAPPAGQSAGSGPLEPAAGPGSVRAPIPGVILSVLVAEGDTVAAGQELCVLEAMKMQNTIRAARPGRIARICVSVGQAVQHQDVLLEYGE